MAERKRGRFITLEGGEAAGKSTQIALLARHLREAGHDVLTTREPGGTAGAERVRSLLLADDVAWTPLAEILLHFAARADHVAAVIRPALATGTWVLCDRFFDSTMAYQGYGLGGDRGVIETMTQLLNITPDRTIVLDIAPEAARQRLIDRGQSLDRYERLGETFFQRVRAGFQSIVEGCPARCALVSGEGEPEAVTARIIAALDLPGEAP